MMDTTYRSSWSRFIISEDIAQGARTKEVGVEADGCEDEGGRQERRGANSRATREVWVVKVKGAAQVNGC